MKSYAVDDAEHRRGLILGLTLAEALLLLLFLLVLAFAARIDTLQVQKQKVENTLQRVKQASIPSDDPAGLGYIQELEKKIDDLEIQNSKLTDAVKGLRADPNMMAALLTLIADAQKIDPNDPPGVLKRGLGIVEAVGNSIQPAEVKSAVGSYSRAKGRSPADGGAHNWPPIITLSEADGHFFESGSSELSPQFRAALTEKIVGRLLNIIGQYDVNVIEVVGHTDEQPVSGGKMSNLDRTLFPSLLARTSATTSEPALAGDNAGLGLARAASVVKVLSSDARLASLRILPLSGAQLIDLGDKLASGVAGATAVKERRRIEIRVRRSDK